MTTTPTTLASRRTTRRSTRAGVITKEKEFDPFADPVAIAPPERLPTPEWTTEVVVVGYPD